MGFRVVRKVFWKRRFWSWVLNGLGFGVLEEMGRMIGFLGLEVVWIEFRGFNCVLVWSRVV